MQGFGDRERSIYVGTDRRGTAGTQREPAREVIEAVPSDAVLMARIAEGDLDALGQLYDRLEPEVRRLVRRLGALPGDVDDLVQLTFLDVHRSAANFQTGRTPRSWVLGVAVMIVRRHRRSLRRWIENMTGHVFERRRAPPKAPDEMLEQCQEYSRFEQALERLSPKRREAFVLVVMEQLSGDAAAAVLGIPVATVWTRLHHARRDLRSMLDERVEDA